MSAPISENQTSTPIFTPSPFQSETPISTSTLSFTATLESTETRTPHPILSQSTSEAEIKQLMQNDIECKLPCFIGVIPGQTTVDELENVFIHFGLHRDTPLWSPYTIFSFGQSEIPPYSKFYIQHGLVQTIDIEIHQTNEFQWSLYSPAAMLNQFGTPSDVTFGFTTSTESGFIPSEVWYYMTFVYADMGLVIEYFMAEVKFGELVTVCPNKDIFRGASILLGKPLEDTLSPTEDGTLEESTSFNLEKFRDFLLLEPNACFDLKSSAVPFY